MKKIFICCTLTFAVSFGFAQRTYAQTNKNVAVQDSALIKFNKIKAELQQTLVLYNKQIKEADKTADKIETLRKKLESAMKVLESNDKMGNFEIQNLMSEYNQAETLSNNVAKKLADSRKAIINKL